MVNKDIAQMSRFERRYGQGSILTKVIQPLNDGKTLKDISKELSLIHPISVPQLSKYIKQFTQYKFYPANRLITYYYGKQKVEEEKTARQMIHEMRVSIEDEKILYVNFGTSQKSA